MEELQKFSTRIPQSARLEGKVGMFLLQEECSDKLTVFSFGYLMKILFAWSQNHLESECVLKILWQFHMPSSSVSGALIGFSHLDVFHENRRLIILSNKLHSFMSYKQYNTLPTGLTANKPLGMLREHSKIWQTFIVFSQIIDTQINESTEKQN